MQIINGQRFLDPNEACNMLGVSMATLRRWRSEGKISSLQLSERKIYYPESDIRSFLNESYVPRSSGKRYLKEVDRDEENQEELIEGQNGEMHPTNPPMPQQPPRKDGRRIL